MGGGDFFRRIRDWGARSWIHSRHWRWFAKGAFILQSGEYYNCPCMTFPSVSALEDSCVPIDCLLSFILAHVYERWRQLEVSSASGKEVSLITQLAPSQDEQIAVSQICQKKEKFCGLVNSTFLVFKSLSFSQTCWLMQALASARTAVGQLDKEGIPWQRPPDYYAEMVKSDGHMSRIKEQLVYEQKQIEQTDERWPPITRTWITAHLVYPLSNHISIFRAVLAILERRVSAFTAIPLQWCFERIEAESMLVLPWHNQSQQETWRYAHWFNANLKGTEIERHDTNNGSLQAKLKFSSLDWCMCFRLGGSREDLVCTFLCEYSFHVPGVNKGRQRSTTNRFRQKGRKKKLKQRRATLSQYQNCGGNGKNPVLRESLIWMLSLHEWTGKKEIILIEFLKVGHFLTVSTSSIYHKNSSRVTFKYNIVLTGSLGFAQFIKIGLWEWILHASFNWVCLDIGLQLLQLSETNTIMQVEHPSPRRGSQKMPSLVSVVVSASTNKTMQVLQQIWTAIERRKHKRVANLLKGLGNLDVRRENNVDLSISLYRVRFHVESSKGLNHIAESFFAAWVYTLHTISILRSDKSNEEQLD